MIMLRLFFEPQNATTTETPQGTHRRIDATWCTPHLWGFSADASSFENEHAVRRFADPRIID